MAYTGTLVLVVGASGSGKGVLLKRAKEVHPEIIFPVSCTTRAARPGEVEGENYHYISEGEFTRRIAAGDFLEWAEYGGSRYGTLKSEIIPALEAGKLVIREVEVQGARLIKEALPPENLVIVYVHAGSWEDLARRIQHRAPMSVEELHLRHNHYRNEQLFREEATYVVENLDGKFPEADAEFEQIIETIGQGAEV